MRFLADNDIKERVVEWMEAQGYEVVRVRSLLPASTPDDILWPLAIRERRIVLTYNRDDFLALASASIAAEEAFAGLIVLKQWQEPWLEIRKLKALLDRAGEQGLANNINFA